MVVRTPWMVCILTVYHSQISVLYHTIANTRLNGAWILVVWSASATLIFSTGLTTYQAWLIFFFGGGGCFCFVFLSTNIVIFTPKKEKKSNALLLQRFYQNNGHIMNQILTFTLVTYLCLGLHRQWLSWWKVNINQKWKCYLSVRRWREKGE